MAVLNFADVSKNAEFGYTLVFKGIFLFQATRYSNHVYVMYLYWKGSSDSNRKISGTLLLLRNRVG